MEVILVSLYIQQQAVVVGKVTLELRKRGLAVLVAAVDKMFLLEMLVVAAAVAQGRWETMVVAQTDTMEVLVTRLQQSLLKVITAVRVATLPALAGMVALVVRLLLLAHL